MPELLERGRLPGGNRVALKKDFVDHSTAAVEYLRQDSLNSSSLSTDDDGARWQNRALSQ